MAKVKTNENPGPPSERIKRFMSSNRQTKNLASVNVSKTGDGGNIQGGKVQAYKVYSQKSPAPTSTAKFESKPDLFGPTRKPKMVNVGQPLVKKAFKETYGKDAYKVAKKNPILKISTIGPKVKK
jgi:hypothetical protein